LPAIAFKELAEMSDQGPNSSPLPHRGETGNQVISAPPSGHAAALISPRNAFFLSLVALSIALFWTPLRTLLEYTMRGGHQYDQYSHTLFIPLISIALAYSARKKIFASVQYGFGVGGVLLLAAVAAEWVSRWAIGTVGQEGSLSIGILGLVIFWMGGFILCYGLRCFRAGKFVLLFLLLTVPVPAVLLNGPVTFVQRGSADVASVVFHVFGVPVFRNEFSFTLPGLTIEIAKECSGIHSILALFIVSLLAGHFTRMVGWKRLLLTLLVFPIVCITNGIRIGTIALLAAYVDPRFLVSSLHRDGGILFFLLGLGLLMIFLHLLGKVGSETRAGDGDGM
jgi:exosortase